MLVLYKYACNTMVHYSQHLPISSMSLMTTTPPTSSHHDNSWCAPSKHVFFRGCYKLLCMIAISRSSVEHWEELRQISIESRQNPEVHERSSTEEQWEKHKKMVIARFQNMNITAGLVLTSSTVFISTNPPIELLVPYANYVSYTLEVFSFVAALISLIVGTSVVIIYDPCYAHADILESFKESRLRLICCLMLMAFPSLALVASTLALMAAVFIAGITSDKVFMKVMSAITCVIIYILLMVAFYVFSTPLKKVAHYHAGATDMPEEEA